MTDDELERMRAYAAAAREHPTWSVAYAQDVPKLLAELERLKLSVLQWTETAAGYAESAAAHQAKVERKNLLLRAIAKAVRGEANGVMEYEHLDELPKDVVGERRIWAEDRERLLAGRDEAWHRLRFCEMVLDRVDAEVDGIPWREAARLSESLDGEPVTEPVAPTKVAQHTDPDVKS